jgi:ribosomal protein L16 Arg81 hydroxylase
MQAGQAGHLNHVESRLITSVDGEWDMQHGPLESLPPRHQREWTMLVQGVNLHDEGPMSCCASSALSRTRASTT